MTAAPPKVVKQIRRAMDGRPGFNPENEDDLREMLAETGLTPEDLKARFGWSGPGSRT